jgi:hypothetical protein
MSNDELTRSPFLSAIEDERLLHTLVANPKGPALRDQDDPAAETALSDIGVANSRQDSRRYLARGVFRDLEVYAVLL